ncbi:hypothetical protein DH2020_043463 [Rehmannia glutinosa]|uniref:Uncharacterized protein n=1 Tax=Rehmannia glutinosa TaxID=99300 RepID=A0ABR0ULA7_REHGL
MANKETLRVQLNVLVTQVHTAIKGYGLEGFITGAAKAPASFIMDSETQEKVINPEFLLWQRQDHILASWILSSLSENILVLMVGLSSSNEIWCVLETNFASQSKAKTLQYKLQLQTTRKGNLSMREYLSKIKTCCDVLASTGNIISPTDQIMHILSGLGSEYDPVMVTITANMESYTIGDVQALLLSFESRLEACLSASINADGSQPVANMATQNSQRRFNSQTQNFRGRGGSNTRGGRGFRGTPSRGRGGRFPFNRLICQVCQTPGHFVDRCWHRYDSSYGLQQQQNSSQNSSNTQSQHVGRNPSLNMVHMPSHSC